MSGFSPAPEQVLATLNKDGSRRWLRPRVSKGRFYKRRLVLAWLLMGVFVALPNLTIGGRPAVLIDLAHRELALFGARFLATDTLLLMLLMVAIFVGVFLLTALYGRVWCGWACPQTIYLEFLFRPIERLAEGGRRGTSSIPRRTAKLVAFGLVSLLLAHTFLAYFVGVEELGRWMRQSPFQHPASFLVMAATAALVFFDFASFREQMCSVACPYGRFQSVLLDKQSLIVGYDAARGEPRGKPGATKGDCVDCGACVTTCPTGLDIRQGFQMECIHCTQCIDACDAIMDRLGRPRGLVKYTSQDELAGAPRRFLRPRVVIYPLILIGVVGALIFASAERKAADVTVLRDRGAPYALLPSGQVSNALRIKVVNRTEAPKRYLIEVLGIDGVELVAPENPIALGPGQSATANVFVVAKKADFASGDRDVTVRVGDGEGFTEDVSYRLFGPSGGGAP